MTDLAEVGRAVLEALAEGRRRAILRQRERAASVERLVLREADLDVIDGGPSRGRAGRIQRRLRRQGVHIRERSVLKILARLSYRADSIRQGDDSHSPEPRS